ncbi:MAG: S8 family serine peptidase, partial [Saprospiraceae bacterium]|nr:S8 family serine peptidase [Saprospiraceae bacterium]
SRERGLTVIHAPEMWALGYTGYGQKAFVADTGVDPSHPALEFQYNGFLSNDHDSWFSFSDREKPFDCDRHGTHVAGTILGLDRNTNDTIGVAFNATWIAGGILCGIGTEDNIGAFEWAMDPDNNPETTEDMPDVINNSWYDPSLGELDCYSIYVPVLEALEAAGIVVVFSAGNEGPEPGTITQPHNINIHEVNAFTVGALNGNNPAHPIASFSSIGPSHCEGEGSIKIKPEVSAPGMAVRSCIPFGQYGYLSGTSMAAPHVSGAILLLKEAFPYLGAKDLKLALYHSCTDLGEPGEDNTFGMGIINVYAAYEYLKNLGYLPVDPVLANDVMLLEIRHALMACEGTLYPYILVENAGVDTLRQFEVIINTINFSDTRLWQGNLAPGAKEYIQLPHINVPPGEHALTVNLEKPNGIDDLKPLNNGKKLKLNVTERVRQLSDFELNENICINSSLILQSPVIEGIKYTTNWYDALYEGNLIYNGNSIKINSYNEKKSFYAEIIYRDKTGVIKGTEDAGSYEDKNGDGLKFDANSQFTLDTMTVYSNEIGIREFYLYNAEGDSINSTKKYLNKIGANVLKMNMLIPAGKNYTLLKKEGKPIFASNSEIVFPFSSSQDIVSITSGIVDGETSNVYKYFYDWKISYAEPCGRIPYTINVRKDSVVGKADFVFSSDTLVIPDQNTLVINDLSERALAYLWNMGDGYSYNTPSVEHTYTNEGKYEVNLQIIDENDCVVSKSSLILVSQITSVSAEEKQPSFQITAYPNPVSGTLNIETENPSDAPIMLELNDINGRILRSVILSKGTRTYQMSMHDLTQGIYFLKVHSGTEVMSIRVVKI